MNIAIVTVVELQRSLIYDADQTHVDETHDVNEIGRQNAADLNENVEKILSKPPGFTLYKSISEKGMELNIEEGMAKLRMNKIKEGEVKHQKVKNVNISSSAEINFQSMKATDMKCNKRVFLLDPSDMELETKSKNLKIELMKGVNAYRKEHNHNKYSNIEEDEREGLSDVINIIDTNKVVVYQTDKSRKHSIDYPSHYKERSNT